MYDNDLEINAYRQLKDVDPATDEPYQVDNGVWIFDLNEGRQMTVKRFKDKMPMFTNAFGTNPNDYVEIFWATPLMIHPGTTCWPKKMVTGLGSENMLQNPVQSLLFLRLLAMFGSQWDQTLAAGTPHYFLDIQQRRPNAVHVRDIVIYRTVKAGLQKTGLTMNIVTDPMMGLDMLAEPKDVDTKKISFCANPKCLSLDIKALKCSGCKVSYAIFCYSCKQFG